MKYFGTDGIRGIVNTDLNKNLIKKLAKAIVKYYEIKNLKKVILIGNDSRISSSYIFCEFCSVLLKNGIKIENLDICSSPCLAYITKKFNYPLSIMITASHNPFEFNGLKFFNSLGEKVDDMFEQTIEILMDKNIKLKNNNFSKIKNVEYLKTEYINYVKSLIKFSFNCIIDCANGGVSKICKSVFNNCKLINFNPDGININKNAGCTNIETLQSMCVKQNMIGFAFDGDGDRVFFVCENGEVINGDKILYLLSKFYLKPNDCVVGTIYTNSGLEKALNKRKINLIRTPVGDKNIYSEMKKNNHSLGGEESGHTILKPYINTGDGLIIAILICNLINMSKPSLNSLLKDYVEDFQIRENIKLTKEQISCLNLEKLEQDFSNKTTKVIIRPSGTEPVLRLFVECSNKISATSTLCNIKSKILELLS